MREKQEQKGDLRLRRRMSRKKIQGCGAEMRYRVADKNGDPGLKSRKKSKVEDQTKKSRVGEQK